MTFPHPSNATHGPPGLGTSGIVTCPRRRQTPSQPPNLLTTSLGNARAGLAIGGFAQTPVSTTSLSSPFSAYPQSPHPQSPGSAMRETSPMSFRSASGFNTTYNPQQWGPVSSSSTNSVPTLGERRQTSQSSRLSHQAPRPGGPDGKEDSNLKQPFLTRQFRTACVSAASLFTSSRPPTVSGFAAPPGRHHISDRYYFSRH